MKRILPLALLLSTQIHASDSAPSSPEAQQAGVLQSISNALGLARPSTTDGRQSPIVAQLTQSQLDKLTQETAAAAVQEVLRQLKPVRGGTTQSPLLQQVQTIAQQSAQDAFAQTFGEPSADQAQLVTQTVVNFLSGKGDMAQGVAAGQAAVALLGSLKEALDTPEERKKAAASCFGACFKSAAAQLPPAAPVAPANTPTDSPEGTVTVLPAPGSVQPSNARSTKPKKLSKEERKQQKLVQDIVQALREQDLVKQTAV